MACGDVLSLEDLQTAKKHQIFEAEVITGKAGGVAGGATIGTATNPVTGQTQQTLPSILADLGFDVQPWTSSTGGVLASANQVFLNDTSGSLGIGDYYAWGGPFPKTVPAGTDPALVGSGYIMRSSRFAGTQAREALRRSYAEAGYNLVDGSFEAGGTLVSANDVLLQERTGKAFSGPAGTVAAGTNPASGGFVDRKDHLSTFLTIKNYGAKVDGVSDDTQAIQAMVNDLGYFTLPPGVAVITDSILIPAGTALGTKWSGAGMEKSQLVCVGMAGKPAITTSSPTAYYRLTMSDFRISGDCASGININILANSQWQLYQSEFRNLIISCTTDSAFKANRHFSTSWYNVHTFSQGGHGFDIQGGNSTALFNCYAHNSGPGMAGYRIRGGAAMIACNGVDNGDIWGDFGGTLEADGSNSVYNIIIIGGNIEDFRQHAITVRYTGRLSFDGTYFVAKASGTYETIIKGDVHGAGDSSLVDRNTSFATKGATMSSESRILHRSGIKYIESINGIFTDLKNNSSGFLLSIPTKRSVQLRQTCIGTQYSELTWDKGHGYVLQTPTIIPDGNPTPDVRLKNTVATSNSSPTIIRQMFNGERGQRITLLIGDSNTTLKHNYGGSNRLILLKASDITAANGDVYEFVFNNGNWTQV